jgi:integrase
MTSATVALTTVAETLKQEVCDGAHKRRRVDPTSGLCLTTSTRRSPPNLTFARPVLLKRAFMIGDDHDPLAGPLWRSKKGAALSYSRVEQIIMATTRLVLGVALSPHDFRRAAATTAAYRAGDRPHRASALLQHTHLAATQEHYNRASTLTAAVGFSRLVRGCP